MGFNLNRLKQQYGIGSASQLPYAGAKNPGDTFAYNEDAINAAEEAISEADQLAAYNAQIANYTTDRSAYDAYSDQYNQRLQGTPMYANKQYQTQKEAAPNTVNEMYQKYLGRENENEEVNDGKSYSNDIQTIVDDTVTDAERNAFLRNAETEFANLGIDNTGNQNVMNQMGNYYGNILGAPVSVGNVYGYGGKPDIGGVVINPATGQPWGFGDPNSPFYEGSLPPDTGGVVIDTGTGGVVDTGVVDTGTGTVDSTGSSNNGSSSLDNFMTNHNARVAEDIAAAGGEPGDTSVLGPVFTGGGADNIGNFGAVGDFFGGIGDAVGITNYSGDNDDDDDDDGGSWSESNWNPSNWFNAEGGYIKGYSNGTTEPIDATLDLDALAAEQLKLAEETTAPNAAALQKMLRDNIVTSQDDSVAGLEQKYQDSTKAFQSAMTNLATQESKGPSESEKWFRISAAFGKPTQSGNFFDGLGNVSEALGDIERERREAKSTGTQLLLENSRFSMDILKEQLATGRTLQADERTYNRRLQEMLYNTQVDAELLSKERVYDLLTEQEKRQWEADNKANLPKTVAAKAATDLGYERGSDKYVTYITDYYANQQKIAKLEVETLARQAEQLTKPVLSLLVETDNKIQGQNNAIGLLEQALAVNKLAYTDSYADRLGNFLAGQFDSDDPKYQATEQLMNLLSKGALATLKATFGGNISDGERAANLDLQGTGSKNRESRALIIQQALTTMLDLRTKTQNKLVDIKTGVYSTRTPIEPVGEE